jgi:hypothetical protein
MGLPARTVFKTFNRRLRPETVRINGVPVKFYRKGRKWHWRAIGGKVKVPRDGEQT